MPTEVEGGIAGDHDRGSGGAAPLSCLVQAMALLTHYFNLVLRLSLFGSLSVPPSTTGPQDIRGPVARQQPRWATSWAAQAPPEQPTGSSQCAQAAR